MVSPKKHDRLIISMHDDNGQSHIRVGTDKGIRPGKKLAPIISMDIFNHSILSLERLNELLLKNESAALGV